MENLSFSKVRTKVFRELEIVFIDKYTKFTYVYSVEQKNKADRCSETFLITASNIVGRDGKICYIRTDYETKSIRSKFSKSR